MKIKTLKFYLIPFKMPITKNTNDNKSWHGYGHRTTLTHSQWERKLVNDFGNQFWSKQKSSPHQKIPKLLVQLCNPWSYSHMQVHVHCCFIPKTRKWNQLMKWDRYSPIDEWLKMWSIYTMEYYSSVKKTEIMKRMELEKLCYVR